MTTGRLQRNVLPDGVRGAAVDHRRRRWREIEQRVSIYLTRYDLDADEVDDLRQECLIKIFRGLPSFEGRAALSTWIYRIVRNEVLYDRRRLKAYQERLTKASQFSESSMSFRTFEDRALSRVLTEGILARVKPLDRDILRLRYLHGLSSAEVGERLGLAPSTVRVRTSGCRTELRSLRLVE